MTAQSIHYGSIWPKQHVFAVLADQLVKDLENATSIPSVVRRYQNEATMLTDLKSGTIQIASTSAIQSLVPETSLMYLPYLYKDLHHFRKVWKPGANAVTKKIDNLILAKASMTVLGYTIIGGRDCILVEKPIQKLQDFHDLKMRVDGAAISKETFDRLGAIPVEVPYYDVGHALHSGRISAAENSTFNMLALNWHTACRYLSITKHRFILNYELVHNRFWNTLDGATRSNIRAAFSEYLKRFARKAENEHQSSLSTFNQIKYISVNTISPTDRSAMELAARPITDQFGSTHNLTKEIEWIRHEN